MQFTFSALLFDVDGTLVDSIPAVDRAWGAFSRRHGLEPKEVMPKIHGRRSIDSIRLLLPHVDAEAEDAWLRERESTDTEGVVAIPGAIELIGALTAPWAIVTSGTTDVGSARIRAAGIPTPRVAVFGEEVTKGKPEPDPFLLAAERLGIAPEECVVFEDTLAGIRAGHAAGMKVIALTTTNTPEGLAEADAIVPDFRSIELGSEGLSLLVRS